MKLRKGKEGPVVLLWEHGEIVYYDERYFQLHINTPKSLHQYLLGRVGSREDTLNLYEKHLGVNRSDAIRLITNVECPDNEEDWIKLFKMASGRRMSDDIFLEV